MSRIEISSISSPVFSSGCYLKGGFMYCSSCGTEVTKELNYCNRCGANLKATASVEEQPVRVVNMRGTIWPMALMVVIGLGIILAGVGDLAKRDIHPAALTWIAICGFVMIFGIASLILRYMSQLSGTSKSVEKTASRKKATISEARVAQLPPSRMEPVSSVTENTTRTFDPAYRKPIDRSQ
jgi:hypothetical protein